MRPIVISIEGVLAKEPLPDNFAAAAPIEEGIWLFTNVLFNVSPIMVTGSMDRTGVEHFLSSNGIWMKNTEFPIEYLRDSFSYSVQAQRLEVLLRVTRMYRGDLIVIDSSQLIRDALVQNGVTVLQPWFSHVRAVVDSEEMVPLRTVSQTWGD